MMEKEPQEVRSEKAFIIKVIEDNMKRGNEPEGTPKKETRHIMEGILPIKFFSLGYTVGKKIKPWIHRESCERSKFIPYHVRIWGSRDL